MFPAAGAVTVIAELALWPSLVAVIVAEPTTRPVTSPLAVTVATAVFELPHVTVRPVSGLPLASLGVATSGAGGPTCALALAGFADTEATGAGAGTVMAAVPLCPSLVAVVVAGPATRPVTSPLAVTVAAAVFELPHVTVRPVSGMPFASLGVAVSCTVWPIYRVAEAGLTDTEATGAGAGTVIAAVPLCPSLVAVIVAEPAARAVTSPLPLTVATVVLLEDHVITRPDSGLPLASCGVAVSCTVWPTGGLAVAGATVADDTGTPDTATLAVPVLPSLVAVIVLEPGASAVTTPLPFTVAIAVLLLDHVTARPVRTPPAESSVVATSDTVPPTSTLAEAGATLTEATGTGITVTVAVSDALLEGSAGATLYGPGAEAACEWP